MPGRFASTTPGVMSKPLDPERQKWERQPGESKRAYDAFTAYRDADVRKIGRVSVHRRWSGEWSWGHRAYEYDLFLARKETEDEVRYRRKMNDKQRRFGSLMQQKAIERLMELNPGVLSPADVRQFIETGAKIERLAAGADTDRTSTAATVSGTIDVQSMGAEEVRDQLQRLRVELAAIAPFDDELPVLDVEAVEVTDGGTPGPGPETASWTPYGPNRQEPSDSEEPPVAPKPVREREPEPEKPLPPGVTELLKWQKEMGGRRGRPIHPT